MKVMLVLLSVCLFCPWTYAYSQSLRLLAREITHRSPIALEASLAKINEPYVLNLLKIDFTLANIGLLFENGKESICLPKELLASSIPESRIVSELIEEARPFGFNINTGEPLNDNYRLATLNLAKRTSQTLHTGLTSLLTKDDVSRPYERLVSALSAVVNETVLFETDSQYGKAVLQIVPEKSLDDVRIVNLVSVIKFLTIVPYYLLSSSLENGSFMPHEHMQMLFLSIWALNAITDPSNPEYARKRSNTLMATLMERIKSSEDNAFWGHSEHEITHDILVKTARLANRMISHCYKSLLQDLSQRMHFEPLIAETVSALFRFYGNAGLRSMKAAEQVRNNPLLIIEKSLRSDVPLPRIEDIIQYFAPNDP